MTQSVNFGGNNTAALAAPMDGDLGWEWEWGLELGLGF